MACTPALKTETKIPAWQYGLVGVLAVMFCSAVMISPAQAGTLTNVLCYPILRYIVQSSMGRGLATLAVMAVGIAAMLGKSSVGMAITVAVGIAILYAATDIAFLMLPTPPGATGPICPLNGR